MNIETNQQVIRDDEIDLVGLFVNLWQEKWTIILVTSLVVILSIIFVFLPVHTFKGKIQLKPISINDDAKYMVLNDARKTLIESLDGQAELLAINRNLLVESFAEELNRRTVFYPYIQKSGLLKQEKDESEEEYLERISQLAYNNVSLNPPNTDNQNVLKFNWTLEIETKSPLIMKQVLRSAMGDAEYNVKEGLITKIANELALKKDQNEFELNNLTFAYNNALATYEEQTTGRLAFLREQADIARSLGMNKPSNELKAFGSGSSFIANYGQDSSVIASASTEPPYYLYGYEAIEKEISLIKSRKEQKPYVEELIEINGQIRKVNSDNSVARVETALANSPLLSESFKAASYDINGIEFKSKTKSVLPVILAVFLGGMIGVVVAIIRSAVKQRSQNAIASQD